MRTLFKWAVRAFWAGVAILVLMIVLAIRSEFSTPPTAEIEPGTAIRFRAPDQVAYAEATAYKPSGVVYATSYRRTPTPIWRTPTPALLKDPNQIVQAFREGCVIDFDPGPERYECMLAADQRWGQYEPGELTDDQTLEYLDRSVCRNDYTQPSERRALENCLEENQRIIYGGSGTGARTGPGWSDRQWVAIFDRQCHNRNARGELLYSLEQCLEDARVIVLGWPTEQSLNAGGLSEFPELAQWQREFVLAEAHQDAEVAATGAALAGRAPPPVDYRLVAARSVRVGTFTLSCA